jgi:hypothetical protein
VIVTVSAKDESDLQVLLSLADVSPWHLEVAEQHAPGEMFLVLFTLPGVDDPEKGRALVGALIVEHLPSIADDITIDP